MQDTSGKEKERIHSIQSKCKEVDLVLYCKNMTDPRKRDDDQNAIKKLAAQFGDEFWKHLLVIFTFANKEDCMIHINDIDEDNYDDEPDHSEKQKWEELKRRRFIHRLEIRREEVKEFLRNNIVLQPSVNIDEIPIVPAGYYRGHEMPLQLPDRQNWLQDLLKKVCDHIKDKLKFAKLDLNDS